MRNSLLRHLLVFVALLTLIVPTDASAYIDPGTGSYILQIIAAGLLGGLFAIKMFWFQVKSFFKRLFSRHDKA
jgi:hypothetical protein